MPERPIVPLAIRAYIEQPARDPHIYRRFVRRG